MSPDIPSMRHTQPYTDSFYIEQFRPYSGCLQKCSNTCKTLLHTLFHLALTETLSGGHHLPERAVCTVMMMTTFDTTEGVPDNVLTSI